MIINFLVGLRVPCMQHSWVQSPNNTYGSKSSARGNLEHRVGVSPDKQGALLNVAPNVNKNKFLFLLLQFLS